MIWLVSAGLAADCEQVAPDALMLELEASEREFGDLNSDGFLTQTADLAQRLPCVSGQLSPAQAAHVHRVFGVRAWLGRQTADARAAFASAKDADPDYVFPFWMLPESHELRDVYGAAEPELAILPVLRPKEGVLLFNGVPKDVRPQLQPVVLQIMDAEGGVVHSVWLRPADGLPAYEATRPVLPPLIGPAKPIRTGLLAGAGVAAVVGVGALALSGVGNLQFDKAQDRSQVFASQRFSNAMVTTSAVGGGVAVLSLSGAFLVGRF